MKWQIIHTNILKGNRPKHTMTLIPIFPFNGTNVKNYQKSESLENLEQGLNFFQKSRYLPRVPNLVLNIIWQTEWSVVTLCNILIKHYTIKYTNGDSPFFGGGRTKAATLPVHSYIVIMTAFRNLSKLQ